MKKLLFSLLLLVSVLPMAAFSQSDTTDLNTLINTSMPDNTSGAITPEDLRNVSKGLMRSNANKLERNVFAEPVEVSDSIKTTDGFYLWDGYNWIRIRNAAIDNQIVVNQGNAISVLGGVIDPTAQYLIDGIIDMGSTTITLPPGAGINIKGLGTVVSKILSSDTSYTMFYSAKSGNLRFSDVTLQVDGLSSKVFDLTAHAGTESVEFSHVNFDKCTSLGDLDGFRQGVEIGTARFSGSPDLTLSGPWSGGYRVETSIAKSIGSAVLFTEGAFLTIGTRFVANINMSGETSAVFSDFTSTVFAADGGLQLFGCSFDGVTNPMSGIDGASVKSRFRDNSGIDNTYIGSVWEMTAEAVTTIATVDVPVKLAGITTYASEVWFNSTSFGGTSNASRYVSEQPIKVLVSATLSFSGGSNDDIRVVVRQYDSSAAGYTDLATSAPITLGSSGSVQNITVMALATLNNQDRVELWGVNNTDNSDITLLDGSFCTVLERAN